MMCMEIKNEFIEHLNHDRADRALAGVLHFQLESGYLVAGHWPLTLDDPRLRHDSEGQEMENDLETAIADLVCNLRHLVDRETLDWDAILRRANRNHTEEQTEP
jgi:hypothetical protein